MFSHVVIFWTDPANLKAADELIAGAHKYLKPIPCLTAFHIGKMVGSHRPVVDQTYQVALYTQFATKQDQDDYQVHPLHLEFVEKVLKPLKQKVIVYDFE
ncbi:MAG: Dabb family protein [Verrucomicrobia bacterium]|nr:Dabb family protein [Verrucomicrobiota bacterium]